MATYVTSDAHGHVRALDAALAAAQPSSDDAIYVIGDMIDRGPDPVGVLKLVRSLPNARVLMGNHEQLMLAALGHVAAPAEGQFDISEMDSDQFLDWSAWMLNGGSATSSQLEQLSEDEYQDVVAWVRNLPCYAVAQAGGRTYAICHAGIDPAHVRSWCEAHPEADLADPQALSEMLAAQPEEDLLWVREAFWGHPTGLVDDKGQGPVVVSGHTPSPYLAAYTGDPSLACTTDDGHGRVVELGACEATGGVADKMDVDCAAAGGPGVGRVGVMRLDDHTTWYATVREGE